MQMNIQLELVGLDVFVVWTQKQEGLWRAMPLEGRHFSGNVSSLESHSFERGHSFGGLRFRRATPLG